jgi:hypothetical protein
MKKGKFNQWLGDKSEDFEEKKSKDIYDVRKQENKKFVQTIRQTISTQGYITTLA